MDAPLLVLWDIDHTLIDAGSVLRPAYAKAFHTMTGRTLEHPWQFDGRTELAAATDALQSPRTCARRARTSSCLISRTPPSS
jgi:hypothetical protein